MDKVSHYCHILFFTFTDKNIQKRVSIFLRRSTLLHFIRLFSLFFLTAASSYSFASSNYSGAILGEFEVSSAGAASYTIPIEVPPGINGMQPGLSLNYDSHRDNNELGQSWTLGGLSSIERCPTTLEQDGFIDGVDFDENDRFCLDGQRLKSIAYNEYRTEMESYSKVTAYGDQNDPDYFEVKTKAGLTKYYGAYQGAQDSRIEPVFHSVWNYQDVALSWALKRVVDASGNYMEFHYTVDRVDGGYKISSIAYSGNENAGIQPYIEIVFAYSTRADVTKNYIAGSVVSMNEVLQVIDTKYNGNLLRRYILTYENDIDTGRSLLANIYECDKGTYCHPPTKFEWDTHQNRHFENSYSGPGYADSYGWWEAKYYSTIQYPDLNGDGKNDICARDRNGIMCYIGTGTGFTSGFYGPRYSDATGWGNAKYYSTIRYPDLNGDGNADICARDANGIECFIGTGSGFTSGFRGPAYADASGWGVEKYYSTIQYPDLNGDGRADICARDSNGIQCFIGSGYSFHSSFADSGYSDAAGWGVEKYYSTIRYPDVNGDGKADICGRDANGLDCYVGTGSGFSSIVHGPRISDGAGWGADKYNSTIQYLELNGDGNADMCVRGASGLQCYLSTGREFYYYFIVNDFSDAAGWDDEKYYSTIRYPDVNGDGKADICARDTNGIQCSINTGSGFSATFRGPDYTDSGGWGQHKHNSTIQYLDANGDGKTDICARDSSGVKCLDGSGTKENIITVITDGLGAETHITYLPLTNFHVYRKGQGAFYPRFDLQAPMYVVSALSRSNGVGGFNTSGYRYEGAVFDRYGRGFLGFQKMLVFERQNLFVTEMHYRQYFPLIGTMLSKRLIYNVRQTRFDTDIQLYGIELSSVTNDSHIFKTYNDAVYVIDQAGGTTDIRTLSGSLVSRTTTNTDTQYDTYGNPISTTGTVTTSDGFTNTTVNRYSNDITNWRLGLLNCITVTKTDPSLNSITRRSGFAYNPTTGQLVKEVIEPEVADCITPTPISVVKDYTYNSVGNKTSSTVSGTGILSRTTSTSYDYSTLNLSFMPYFRVTTTNALGHSTSSNIDARFGVPILSIDPNMHHTNWTYDGLGRRIGEYRVDGSNSSFEYLSCDAGTTCSDPLQQSIGAPFAVRTTQSTGQSSTVYFDSLGREIMSSVSGFDGRKILKKTNYDIYGNVASVSNPYFENEPVGALTRFEYDVLSRVTAEEKPDGSRQTMYYNGFTTAATNDKGQTSWKIKNSQGHLLVSIDAMNYRNYYTYDPVGNLLTVTDPHGNVTRMSYDQRGNKISMDDPDMGQWSYVYDVLGNLIQQTDAKGQSSTMVYDQLSRMVFRVDRDGATNWTYDTSYKGIGKLSRVTSTSSSGYERYHYYDNLSRPLYRISKIQEDWYTFVIAYEPNSSRVSTSTYPSGFQVKYVYNAFGVLSEKRNVANNALLWKAQQVNAFGQITNEDFGTNGLKSVRSYDSDTGRLRTIATGLNGGWGVQSLSYDFDTIGNLTARRDNNQGLTETATYDVLNRLLSTTVAGLGTKTYRYDAIGNIKFKSDFSAYNYVYGEYGAGPHAVTRVGFKTYSYDANGNMVNGDGRFLTYTSFNKPRTVTKAVGNIYYGNIYYYNADRQRMKKVSTNNGVVTTTRTYVGKTYEVVEKSNGITEYKHFIGAGSATYLYTTRSNNTMESRFMFKDHIGSMDVITDENGVVVESLSFDPFGDRRNANWTQATSVIQSLTARGFTGHEMDDEVGLINMNARMYDQKLGRFLQPDVFVQYPTSTQGFNRYTYVNNNPLSYTDPSGHFLGKLFKKIMRHAEKHFNAYRKLMYRFDPGHYIADNIMYSKPVKNLFLKNSWARTVGFAVASYFGGPMGAAAFSAYLTEIAGGSFEDMAKSFAMSMAMSYVSGGFELGKPVANPSLGGLAKHVYNSVANSAKRKLVARVVQKNTNLSANEFNMALFAISAASHYGTSDDGRPNPLGTNDRHRVEGEFDEQHINVTGWNSGRNFGVDLIDGILAWQGLPTGNTFQIMAKYRAGLKVRGYSLGSIEVNNLIAAGVIDGSNATMDGIIFGTVGLADNVNFNADDIGSFGGASMLFNPTVEPGIGGHDLQDYNWSYN